MPKTTIDGLDARIKKIEDFLADKYPYFRCKHIWYEVQAELTSIGAEIVCRCEKCGQMSFSETRNLTKKSKRSDKLKK